MKRSQKSDFEFDNKIMTGLSLAYDRLIAEKRAKNEEIVVMRDNKIISFIP
ncbi:MAG: hypothetical protein LBN23_03975 [Paludibacter sp.]|jgi:hypothetical protein|nr:hypothetical protein [Paludibacter sp.]